MKKEDLKLNFIFLKMISSRLIIILFLLAAATPLTMAQYLKRSLSSLHEVKTELSTPAAHYNPMFGAGDDNSSLIKGLNRYGNLVIDSAGSSNPVKYAGEEVVIYVLGGTGLIIYGKEKLPVTKNDFIYIPAGTKFTFSNPREKVLSLFVMGFKTISASAVKPSSKVMIANTDYIPFQILGSHGPSTQFQLLMGTTESIRDRLAAACQVTSLFIMDFAAEGTNIPHKHDDEEEIYFILRGAGDIVAGENPDGSPFRHPSIQGDAYFFSPKTLIGFYSGNKEGEEHARILAVRFKYPVTVQ